MQKIKMLAKKCAQAVKDLPFFAFSVNRSNPKKQNYAWRNFERSLHGFYNTEDAKNSLRLISIPRHKSQVVPPLNSTEKVV